MNSGIFSVGNDGAEEYPNLPKDAQSTDLSLSLYLPMCLTGESFQNTLGLGFPEMIPFLLQLLKLGNA